MVDSIIPQGFDRVDGGRSCIYYGGRGGVGYGRKRHLILPNLWTAEDFPGPSAPGFVFPQISLPGASSVTTRGINATGFPVTGPQNVEKQLVIRWTRPGKDSHGGCIVYLNGYADPAFRFPLTDPESFVLGQTGNGLGAGVFGFVIPIANEAPFFTLTFRNLELVARQIQAAVWLVDGKAGNVRQG